jgi:hypothetical protein
VSRPPPPARAAVADSRWVPVMAAAGPPGTAAPRCTPLRWSAAGRRAGRGSDPATSGRRHGRPHRRRRRAAAGRWTVATPPTACGGAAGAPPPGPPRPPRPPPTPPAARARARRPPPASWSAAQPRRWSPAPPGPQGPSRPPAPGPTAASTTAPRHQAPPPSPEEPPATPPPDSPHGPTDAPSPPTHLRQAPPPLAAWPQSPRLQTGTLLARGPSFSQEPGPASNRCNASGTGASRDSPIQRILGGERSSNAYRPLPRSDLPEPPGSEWC